MNGFNAKRIADPVHGTIGLSELEVQVISTRVFQRLRNVKQLYRRVDRKELEYFPERKAATQVHTRVMVPGVANPPRSLAPLGTTGHDVDEDRLVDSRLRCDGGPRIRKGSRPL